MAQGDIKVAMSNIAGSALWTVQPSSGESWLIDRVGSPANVGNTPTRIPDVSIHLYDGSNSTYLGGDNAQPEAAAKIYSHPLQVYINNTVYVQLRNNASTTWITYSGIQTK